MDAVTKKWFDDASVTVVRAPALAGFMTDAHIARITGAPRDSVVHIYADERATAFRVDNAILSEPMYRYLFQHDDGSYAFYLKNAAFVLADDYTNHGIGARCVIREIDEAASWGRDGFPISHISMWAVGDFASFSLKHGALRGYYVWATMGVDADIPALTLAQMDPPFNQCRRISQLISTDMGRAQWRTHGISVDLRFDLAPRSTSWLQLRRYMKHKGISI